MQKQGQGGCLKEMGGQEEHCLQNREPSSRPAAIGVCNLCTDILSHCDESQDRRPTLGGWMVCYGIEIQIAWRNVGSKVQIGL